MNILMTQSYKKNLTYRARTCGVDVFLVLFRKIGPFECFWCGYMKTICNFVERSGRAVRCRDCGARTLNIC